MKQTHITAESLPVVDAMNFAAGSSFCAASHRLSILR